MSTIASKKVTTTTATTKPGVVPHPVLPHKTTVIFHIIFFASFPLISDSSEWNNKSGGSIGEAKGPVSREKWQKTRGRQQLTATRSTAIQSDGRGKEPTDKCSDAGHFRAACGEKGQKLTACHENYHLQVKGPQ